MMKVNTVILSLLLPLVPALGSDKVSLNEIKKKDKMEMASFFHGLNTGQLKNPHKLIDVLIYGLDSPDPSVRRNALFKTLYALADKKELSKSEHDNLFSPEKLAALREELKNHIGDLSPEIRGMAMVALIYSGEKTESTYDIIIEQLESEMEPTLKIGVLKSMIEAGYNSHVERLLIDMLDHQDKYVRIRAVQVIESIEDPVEE